MVLHGSQADVNRVDIVPSVQAMFFALFVLTHSGDRGSNRSRGLSVEADALQGMQVGSGLSLVDEFLNFSNIEEDSSAKSMARNPAFFRQ